MVAWDWREDLFFLVSLVSIAVFYSVVGNKWLYYHEGSGSLVCRLATREPRECVSWTSR